jgi:hypothetical protein
LNNQNPHYTSPSGLSGLHQNLSPSLFIENEIESNTSSPDFQLETEKGGYTFAQTIKKLDLDE